MAKFNDRRTGHSQNFEKYKRYYDNGLWVKEMVLNITKRGKLTPEEYEEITGEAYLE